MIEKKKKIIRYQLLIFIPARSGSKRFKNKNLQKVGKHSLISKSITFSKKINAKKYIYLSTDSKKYAKEGLKYGAYVPFLRSKKNSSDKSSINQAIIEFLIRTKDKFKFEYILIILPTQPFRTLRTFKKVFSAIKKKNISTVITVKSTERSENLLFKLKKNGLIDRKLKVENSQFMKNFFTPCGCFYLTKVKNFLRTKNLFNGKIFSIKTNFPENIDIDRKIDLKVASSLKHQYI